MTQNESILKVAEELRKNPTWVFEIFIPNSSVRFRKTRQSEAKLESDCLENYFVNFFKKHNLTQGIIQLSSPNGTSYAPKSSHIVVFDENNRESSREIAVKSREETVKSREISHGSGADLRGIDDIKDYKLRDIEHKYDELKTKNADLEHKYRELQDENFTQKRTIALADEKHEFALLKEKHNQENAKKEGLSGILGELNNLPPEMWKVLAGFFPNNPGAQALLNGSNENTNTNTNTAQVHTHADKDAEESLKQLRLILHTQPVEVVAMVQMIVQKMLEKPKWLKAVFETAYPEEKKVDDSKEPNLDDNPQ